MGNSPSYKGHPSLFGARRQLIAQRERDRAAIEARLREAEREASPIVVPAPRRERKTTPEAAPPIEEITTQQEN